MALVPEMVPHEVRNAGDGVLRFAAVYAAPDVVTTYEAPVQPAGEREREATA
jgi:oxalate decarboxylase/phosphoglucose isomerase-like protein (cupin superfamily)